MFEENKETQNIPVSPIPEEPEKKSSNKVVIGVIAGIMALLLVVALVLILGGLFKDNKKTVTDALKATFSESGDYIREAWGTEQYKGMFEGKIYTVDAQLDLTGGIGLDMVIQKNEDCTGLYAEGSLAGSAFLDMQLYEDEEEVRMALPSTSGYVFIVNKETCREDVQNLVDMGMLDQQTVDEIMSLYDQEEIEAIDEEAYEKLQKEIIKSCVTFFDKCEVKKGKSKKLTVDGKSTSCDGYILSITGENMSEFAEDLKAAYQGNEDSVESIFRLYESMDIELDLEEIYDSLDEIADSCRDAEKEAEIEIYLHDGRVAQIYMEFEEDDYIEWNVEGGNFPLENTNLVIEEAGETIFEIKRTGYERGGYHAEYELSDEYDTYMMELEYSKTTGEFVFELSEKGYGDDYSILYTFGNFKKTGDSTIAISIDALDIYEESVLSGDIIIENTCSDIERPEGIEKNLFLLTEDEWQEILMEIAMSMYS